MPERIAQAARRRSGFRLYNDARAMDQNSARTYAAALGNLSLKIWVAEGGFRWIITNAETGADMARGESADLPGAMVAAAEVAGAEWGALRWRSSEPDDEDDSAA